MPSERFRGRVALITGGSRGIGRAAAAKLAGEGASVAVNYLHREEAAREVVGEIQSSGGQALAVQADVAAADQVERMVEESSRKLGPIDILVNNAGILHKGDLLSYDGEQFDRMWRTNVEGVVHCSAAVVSSMMEKRFGRIVNLSSIAALGTAFSGTTFYAATKAAVLNLTQRFAFELGPHGICVNAVCPGFIATDMVFEGQSQDEIDQSLERVAARSVLGRAGQPEDIANVICFLSSDEAGFMTGQALTADGGRIDFLTHA